MDRLAEHDEQIEQNEQELDSLEDQIQFYDRQRAGLLLRIERLDATAPPHEHPRLEHLVNEATKNILRLRMRQKHLSDETHNIGLEYRELHLQNNPKPDHSDSHDDDKPPGLKPKKPKR